GPLSRSLADLELRRRQLSLIRPGGTALAEHVGRHALEDLAHRPAIFEDGEIGMGVHVDEAGRDDEALGVDFALALGGDPADRGDLAALDGEVAVEPGVARAIDDLAVAKNEVERRLALSGQQG